MPQMCFAECTYSIGLKCSTNVILAEAAEGPLKERFKYLLDTSRYILKIFSQNTHITLDKKSVLLWYARKPRLKDPGKQFLLYNSFKELLKYK